MDVLVALPISRGSGDPPRFLLNGVRAGLPPRRDGPPAPRRIRGRYTWRAPLARSRSSRPRCTLCRSSAGQADSCRSSRTTCRISRRGGRTARGEHDVPEPPHHKQPKVRHPPDLRPISARDSAEATAGRSGPIPDRPSRLLARQSCDPAPTPKFLATLERRTGPTLAALASARSTDSTSASLISRSSVRAGRPSSFWDRPGREIVPTPSPQGFSLPGTPSRIRSELTARHHRGATTAW